MKYQRLRALLLQDFWAELDFQYLLCGYLRTPEDGELYSIEQDRVIKYGGWANPLTSFISDRCYEIHVLWSNDRHPDEVVVYRDGWYKWDRNYCLSWAVKKKFDLPWLDWAIESGLLSKHISQFDHSDETDQKHRLKSERQRQAILKKIRDRGHDPKNLPKTPQGKSGIKADIRNHLDGNILFTGNRTFDNQWQALRDLGEIKEST